MEPIIRTWQEWCQVFNKVEVWRPLIKEIARRHGLHGGDIRPGYEGTNAVFLLGTSAVVKIVSPFFRNDYERELQVYHLLEQEQALPTPMVLGEGIIDGPQPWPYMVLSLLPGERLGAVWTQVPPEDQLAIARHFGELTHCLHAQPLAQLTAMDATREAWQRFLAGQMAQVEAHFAAQGLPAHLLEALEPYLARIQPLCPTNFTPCLLSADLTEDHELLSLVDGHWRITGLIDFGDAEIGHADYDFICVQLGCFRGDKGLLRAFLEGYGYVPDARFSQRLMGYSLLHRFADMRPWIEALGGAELVRAWEELAAYLWRI